LTVYQLYLESGPKHKKTMVHVLDLLGCVATGPTTEEAVARTPAAIRAFLDLLHRHGEKVDPKAKIETEVADHITEGDWLGNGSPYITFPPDKQPLTTAEIERFIPWLEWMRADMLALIAPLSDAEWAAEPEQGRPVRRIVEHVASAEYNFVRVFGKIPGLAGPGAMEKMGRDELLVWMDNLRECELARLSTLTEEERTAVMTRGESTRTARQMMRRMLEHQWEHLAELRERLG
jgi:predicted RNase H-like HicB family nuclease/uncharacterized damage-inducible protein DinB